MASWIRASGVEVGVVLTLRAPSRIFLGPNQFKSCNRGRRVIDRNDSIQFGLLSELITNELQIMKAGEEYTGLSHRFTSRKIVTLCMGY